ncbi:MAG: polysaccharide deacetylase family protein [Bacteroidia bacterium]|nr:MAG: polysaccharide deacetylase family protein [Bacteroidia bacterium]
MRRNIDSVPFRLLLRFPVIMLILPLIISCSTGNAKMRGFEDKEEVKNITYQSGAVIRGDSSIKTLSLVFTGDSYAEGGEYIMDILAKHNIRGSFFFTGNFYRNPQFNQLIVSLRDQDHYLGPHSDRHLLYCAWENRDSLLVSESEFRRDMANNLKEMEKFGIRRDEARIFMPPFEWYNTSIARWSEEFGLVLINYTPGSRSHTDYTTPSMSAYTGSKTILESIYRFNEDNLSGLNGFILLTHIGAGEERTDKFFLYLDELISTLSDGGYTFCRIDSLPGLRLLL